MQQLHREQTVAPTDQWLGHSARNRQADRVTDRQTDRGTDRQTDRPLQCSAISRDKCCIDVNECKYPAKVSP